MSDVNNISPRAIIDPSWYTESADRAILKELQKPGRKLKVIDLQRALNRVENAGQRSKAERIRNMIVAAAEGAPDGAYINQSELRTQTNKAAQAEEADSAIDRDIAEFMAKVDRKLVGQEDAKETIALMYERLRTGYSDTPVIALASGPPGVGKTLVSKILAETFHGDDGDIRDKMVFIDCTRIGNKMDFGRLVGIGKGYIGYEAEESVAAFSPSKLENLEDPLIIHIDEPDKLPPEVAGDFWNMLNRFFETGELELSNGQVLKRKKVMVVMASNAGIETVGKKTGAARRDHFMQSAEDMLAKHTDSRVDFIVGYDPHTQKGLERIADLEIGYLFDTAVKKKKDDDDISIALDVAPEVKNFMARATKNDEKGARRLTKAIDNLVGGVVARGLVDAEDESRYDLTIKPGTAERELDDLVAAFQKEGGRIPRGTNPKNFPIRLGLANPPPRFLPYAHEAAMPYSEEGPMRPMGSCMHRGRPFFVAKVDPNGDTNRAFSLVPGRAGKPDEVKEIEIPKELGTANVGLQVTALDDMRMLFIGTHIPEGAEEPELRTFIYDAKKRTKQFEEVEPPPVPLAGATLAGFDGEAILTGGRMIDKDIDGNWLTNPFKAPTGSDIEDIALRFDGETKTWDMMEGSPGARVGMATVEVDGKLWFIGGEETIQKPNGLSLSRSSKRVSIYDPETREFSEGPELPDGIGWSTAFLDDFGRIQLAGGQRLVNKGRDRVENDGMLRIDPSFEDARWKSRPGTTDPGSQMLALHHPDGTVVGPFVDEDGEARWDMYKSPEVDK